MGSRPCLHGVGAGIDGRGWVPVREDKSGGWILIPVFTGEDSSRALTRGWVSALSVEEASAAIHFQTWETLWMGSSLSSRGQALRRH